MLSDYVPPAGPIGNPAIAIVGIAPGKDEVKSGQPFTGPSGAILRQDLKEVGIDFEDCYRTNVFKYLLPENEFKRHTEIGLSLDTAIKELTEELNAMKPNVIIGLGEPPLIALAGKGGKNNGIGVWRGSILNVLGRKAIFTYHPAAELHGQGDAPTQWKPYQKYIRKFDIARAVQQSAFPEFRLPSRLLSIAESSADVYNFIERGKAKSQYCAVDIEAIEGIPVCIGLAFTPYEAISIPLWDTLQIQCTNEQHKKKSYAYNLKVSNIPQRDLAHIWRMLAKFFIDTNIKFIGQNFKYDEVKLRNLGFFFHSIFADIGIISKCISAELPANLAFMTSIHTLEPYYKTEGKEFNPRYDKIADLLYYNCKDAACTIEIFLSQMEEAKEILYFDEHMNFRMQLHALYRDIENVGFRTNPDAWLKMAYKYCQWSARLEAELFSICKQYGYDEAINVRSPQQVDVLLYDRMKIPRRKGTGEEILTSLLGNTVKKPDQVRAIDLILEIRKVNKTIDTYLAAGTDYDSRMRSSYFITGTETFRTSTSNMSPPVRPEESGWAIQTVTKHGDIGDDLRTWLVPDKGYVFVNIDQSQAEARVCSLLADDEETLKLYDTVDIHGLTAAKIFDGKLEDYDKKIVGFEKPERFIGKTGRHAYHLGVGKHMLMLEVNTSAKKYGIPIKISEWRANQILDALAKMTPKIQSVYHATIQELLAHDRRIYGTLGASRYFYEDWGKELFKEAYALIPQQTISDKTKSVLLKVRKNRPDVFIMAESHDAGLFMVRDIGNTVYDFVQEAKSYFLEPIDFSRCSIPRRNLVIPCDVEIGYDYCNLEKYKGRAT